MDSNDFERRMREFEYFPMKEAYADFMRGMLDIYQPEE